MTPTEWATAIVVGILLYTVLQGMTWVGKKIFRIDSSERELVLQAQINQLVEKTKDHEELVRDHQELKRTVREQEQEIEDLRKQVKLLVDQYEDALGRLGVLQEQYATVSQENKNLKLQIKSSSLVRERGPQRILMVMIGSEDAGLSLDLASIRAVRTETGLQIKEISSHNPGFLKRELDEAKQRGDHIYLHLAVKADKEGYQMGNQIVDVSWLSSILDGVLVLVVAGTDSDYVGEFLGVVPYVVTMSGSIAHREAAVFSRSFWLEIGKGIGPTLALKRALSRSPQSIRDQIVCHWQD